MLVNFKVGNFLSFKNLQEFSMVAGKDSAHPGHVVEGTVNVLDRAVIFGPNSSGKSNFVYALAYAQEIVKNKEVNNSTILKLYEDMSYNGKEPSPQESYFEFIILLNGKLYSYGFQYYTQLKMFLSEWLIELMPDGSEKNIFSIGFSPSITFSANLYEDKVSLENHSPLDGAFLLKSISRDSKKVYKWLTRSLFIVTTLKESFRRDDSIDIEFRPESLQFLMRYLAELDTGIDGIRSETDWGNIKLESSFSGITHLGKDDLKLNINTARNSNTILYLGKDGDDQATKSWAKDVLFIKVGSKTLKMDIKKFENQSASSFTDKSGEGHLPDDTNIHFTHRPSHFEIQMEDESEGTKKIVQILMLLLGHPVDVSSDYTLVYDEFECSIHFFIIRELLKIYGENRKGRSMQLIITTHESRLLDSKILRPDEIWFVNSDADDGSSIYSLDSFKDYDTGRYDLEYLRGRFQAIPRIRGNEIKWEAYE